MFWTILALSMTVMVGGFIAYNGDLVGRKLGKRRISLFGLRPRNTAILVTTAFGIGISAFTTGILFLVVPPVRNVILDGEDAIRQKIVWKSEKKRIQAEIESLGARNSALQDRNEGLTSRQGQLVVRLNQIGATLQRKQAELRNATARRDAALAETNRLQGQVSRLQAEIGGQKQRLAALVRSNHALAERYRDLSGRNAVLVRMNQDLARSNVQLAKDNDLAARNNDEFAKQNENLERTNRELTKIRNDLQTYNASLQTQNTKLEGKNKELQETRNTLLAVASQQNVGIGELSKRLEAMRTRRVAVHGGEDLARRVVPARSTPKQVRAIIDDLIHGANQAALARGSAPSDGSALAVQVVDKQFEALTPFGNIHPIEVTEADRIDALMNRLSGADMPVCLLAIAVANSVEGEPAAIDFQPFVDRLIYTRGYVIAAQKLDATKPMEKLYPEVMVFLKDLGETARKRGVIPNIDPATGDPQVGALTWPELADLVERVRVAGRRIKLTARAADDTTASGPLRIDFRIDPSL